MSDPSSWLSEHVFLILVAIGAIGPMTSLPVVGRAMSTRTRPTTRGQIESSRVIDRALSSGTQGYGVEIVYTYDARGKTHHGDRLGKNGSFITNVRSAIQKVVDRYPPTKEVTVYYNPADPPESMLNPGVGFVLWFSLLIPVMFLAVGAAGQLGVLPLGH